MEAKNIAQKVIIRFTFIKLRDVFLFLIVSAELQNDKWWQFIIYYPCCENKANYIRYNAIYFQQHIIDIYLPLLSIVLSVYICINILRLPFNYCEFHSNNTGWLQSVYLSWCLDYWTTVQCTTLLCRECFFHYIINITLQHNSLLLLSFFFHFGSWMSHFPDVCLFFP